MWRTDQVKPDPTSWSVILDPNEAQKYSGKISVYDDPIYIADAAVYLKAHHPDLGIEDPYELDENQFNAAVDLLKQQHPFVGDYWSSHLKQINLFTGGDDAVGTTWQYQYFTLQAEDVPVRPWGRQGFVPEEGATGWSDTWMISSEAEASELHVPVDELHHRCRMSRPRSCSGSVRRPLRARHARAATVEADGKSSTCSSGSEVLRQLPRRAAGTGESTLLGPGLLLEDAPCRLRRRPGRRLQGLQRLGLGLDRDQGVMWLAQITG